MQFNLILGTTYADHAFRFKLCTRLYRLCRILPLLYPGFLLFNFVHRRPLPLRVALPDVLGGNFASCLSLARSWYCFLYLIDTGVIALNSVGHVSLTIKSVRVRAT